MGVVYMAEQEQPVRRRVALKIIKPGMDSRQVIARFEAERQALAMMDHPNIARVFDAGTTPGEPGRVSAGRPFFVMELVYGVPITKFCDDSQLTPRERLELFVPICQAIQHAHQKGIIHRDIKPSNVLVTMHDDKPVPKVIDFGVAKAIEQRLTEKSLFTAFGTVVGTLEYMSPEQAEMNAFGVDTRGDVYSLGVLLYELLTGTTPLERKRLREAAYTEVLRLIKEVEPPRPSVRLSSSGDLPKIAAARKTEPARLSRLLRGEIDWIVMRCLEKDRTRRYESASAVARDVERYLRDEAVEACPPSVAYRLSKFARKYRVMLSTAAAFAALLVIAAGVSIWLARTAMQAESVADEKREAAEVAQQKEADERNRADREAAQAKANAAETGRALDRMSVAKGIQLAEEGNLFAALPWFVKPLERGELTPAEEQVHRTRIACYLRHTKGRPRLRQFFFHDGPVSHAAWSADTKRVLTICKNIVYVWDVDSGKAITTLRHPTDVTAAQFTLDDSRVLTVAKSFVWCWDARNGQQLEPPLIDWGAFLQQPLAMLAQTPLQFIGNVGLQDLTDSGWNYVNNEPPEICRDGQRALFSCKRVLGLLDLKTHKLIGRWLRANWPNSGHALSPDGRRLLLVRDGVVTEFDTISGRVAKRSINQESPVQSVAFGPDGARAVTNAQDGIIRIWDSTTWQQTGRIRVVQPYADGYQKLSPDNRLLACWGSGPAGDWGFAWWDVESGQLVGKMADRPNNADRWFAWRPDGQQNVTASVGGEVALWNASDGWNKALMLPHESPLSAAVYAPDGRSLLTATEDGTARIWDLRDREEPVTLKTSREDDFSASIGLYGRFLPSVGTRINYFDEVTLKTVVNSETIVWPDRTRIASFLPPNTLSANQIHVGVHVGAISPDGSRVITIHEESVQLWDALTKTRVGKPLKSSGSLIYVAFSPDSRFVVSASYDGGARLVNAKTGEVIGGPLRHEALNYAAFSPNCELLVTCGGDRTARLWRTQTGQPASEGLPHGHIVTSAAFSPNGQTLATAAWDGTVRLWDVTRGAPVGVLEWKKGSSCAIAFHPSGSLLLVTSLRTDVDDNLRIWDADSLQEVSPAFKGSYGEAVGIAPPLGFRFGRDDQFVVGPLTKTAFDLTPDRRPVADLVKLSQLYSEQRLDAKGGAIPLHCQELQALWQELRAKYPEEFTVSPKAAVEWRIKQIPLNPTFHRRWLAAELAEVGWFPRERGNEDMERNTYLQRILALALHGRHAEATAAADALAARGAQDEDTLYYCACVHALAAGSVKSDATLADRYAARAVALLDRAITGGFKEGYHITIDGGFMDTQHILEHPNLEALQKRNDFQMLLKKLNAKQP